VEGRWTLLPAAARIEDVEELAEAAAWQLLLRWGVVFRDVYLKERLAVPWRDVLWALRRLEARGLIQGGRFVTGVTGEQFAEERAMRVLRSRRGSRSRAGGRSTSAGNPDSEGASRPTSRRLGFGDQPRSAAVAGEAE
jgi:ATP-dependent Lhr-like helicase